MSVYMSVCLFGYQYIYVSVCLSIYISDGYDANDDDDNDDEHFDDGN